MYRSGWSYKDPRQTHILEITMSKAGFLALLEQATPEGGLIRYQWDPERNIKLERLPYRSLQLGISGEMVSRWIDEWIVGIVDITEKVRRWKGYMDDEGEEGVEKAKSEIAAEWSEDVFELSQELEGSLGMRSSEE